MTNNDIVQKLWNLCDVLRDDGINYSDYVTELVLLLFIKMVHENTEAGVLKKHPLPEGCRWTDINKKSGINLLNDYKALLFALSTGKRMEADPDKPGETKEVQVHEDPLISAIYADAQTRLREPRHLEQMIKTLDQIDWFSAQKDGLGDLYEGLLEKNANETKSGAGQYFTPRALINTMVHCLKPQPGERIQDPAAGTAGFLIAAHEYIKSQTDDLYTLSDKDKTFQTTNAYVGIELVPGTRRLALMNCLLHGMEGDEEGVVHLGNALGQTGSGLEKADVIRIEQHANNALARVNKQSQSILAKAFQGELTEQWRKDNPDLISGEHSAAALLERIKTKQAAQTPHKQVKKYMKVSKASVTTGSNVFSIDSHS